MYPYTKQIEPTATAEGEFSDGNPQLNQARTILRSFWPNMIQRELLAILQAAGITPEQESYTQVKQAIQALINSGDASVLQSAINQDSALNTSLRSYIDDQVASAINQAAAYTNQSHIGQITAGPYNSIPAGWLALEGGSFSQSTYPELYHYIDSYYGFSVIGPGNFNKVGTTIYLPDMRGLFVRGYGGSSDGLGFKQDFAQQKVTGSFKSFDRGAGNGVGGAFANSDTRWSSEVASGRGDSWGTTVLFDSSKSDNGSTGTKVQTATEVRPVNVAWRYIIRAI